MIPGRALHRVARALCSPAFCEQVVEPLLADVQHECSQATGQLERVRTLVSGYAAFWHALGLHALQVWWHELPGLTWRDTWPFPGAYAILVVLLAMSNDWVRTGTMWNVWKASIDAAPTCVLVPLALAQRWIPTNGIRNIAIYMAIAYPAGWVVMSAEGVRPLLRGWVPFFISLCVITLVQPKKRAASVVESPHRD